MSQSYLVVDDDGIPAASIDVDSIQAAATTLGFDLATAAGDESKVRDLLAHGLAEHGPTGFGYVTGAALRHVIDNVLAPVLEVTDALHATGHLAADLRAGLADAARNAKETLR